MGQTHHVAFRAKDDEDLRAWQDHLRGMGLRATEILDRSYFHSVYFQAPDGLILELATDGPGFAIDEAAEALGGRLQLPTWLEDEREEIEKGLVPLTK